MVYAATVSWEGLTWTTRGSSTTAVVDANGYLEVSVVGGNSGDPSPDNWAVYAKNFISSSATSCWMEFTFTDPGGAFSPRAYVSAPIVGGASDDEMLIQGGVIAPTYAPTTYTNMNVYTTTGGWVFNDWNTVYTDRRPGDHTFKVGLGSNGEIDVFYDGNLIETYRIGQSYDGDLFDWTADYLKIAYLGVDTAAGSNATIIYKDFQLRHGIYFRPPSPLGAPPGLGAGGLAFYRKRRAVLKG